MTSLGRSHKRLFALRLMRARAPARPSDRIRKLKAVMGREKGALSKPPRDTLCLSEGFSRPGSSLLLKTQRRTAGGEGGEAVNTGRENSGNSHEDIVAVMHNCGFYF